MTTKTGLSSEASRFRDRLSGIDCEVTVAVGEPQSLGDLPATSVKCYAGTLVFCSL